MDPDASLRNERLVKLEADVDQTRCKNPLDHPRTRDPKPEHPEALNPFNLDVLASQKPLQDPLKMNR